MPASTITSGRRYRIAGRFGQFELDRTLGLLLHDDCTRHDLVHPEAERFLQLGDFRFFRIDPVRIRVVGGFAQAGWLEGDQLLDAPHIALEEEVKLIEGIGAKWPKAVDVLGVDAYGLDYRTNGIRMRAEFKAGPCLGDAAKTALGRALKNL